MKRDEFYKMMATTVVAIYPIVLAFAAIMERSDFKWKIAGDVAQSQAICVVATLLLSCLVR